MQSCLQTVPWPNDCGMVQWQSDSTMQLLASGQWKFANLKFAFHMQYPKFYRVGNNGIRGSECGSMALMAHRAK